MRPPVLVRDSAPKATMACPMCKDEFTVKKDWTERGAYKPDKLTASHLCNECGTALKTTGSGKQAVTVATHTCMACTK